MFCGNCGKELSADSKFCTNCGCPVQNILELDVSKERTDCETVCSEHIESCGSEEAASHIENNKSENVSDIFDRLAYYRQNEKTDSEEYRKTVKQEKKAYFWYKLMVFALLLAFATATEMFVRNEHIGVRVLVVILFFVAVGAIVFLCGKRIESFTNLKFLTDNDNEDRSDRLKAQFEREHAGGFRWIKRLEILAVILGVVMFRISLFSEDAGVAASIYVGIKTFYQYGLIFLSIWTFKWACILVWVILFVLPGGVLLLNWESSNLPYGAFNSGPDTDVFAENKYADMIEVDYSNCYVYMTAYTEVPVFHLEYKFTNSTDQTTSAFNIFTAKASQNGIEATTYYNLDLDENELKEVAPGATIGIAEEFELNDIETPLVVQFAETWNFTEQDNIYAEEIFDLPLFYSDNVMTMQEENSESNLTTADTGLTNYVGKWYASNLDGSPAFRTEPYLDDVYQSIFGLELELIQIDNGYYAYLYSNLHFFDYGFAYQTLNGDPLLPVAQIDESTWEIRYDETDPSSEDHRIIGNPIVTLSINPLGELYVEITEAETPIERTKLYSSEEWLNGQYADYDQEQSFSTDWNEEGETYDCTVFDCARLLSENAYGRWYADPFIYDIESGEIRIKSCQSSYFRGMTDLTVVFSLQSDPEENHTLYIDYESYAEIDGIPAERVS